MDDGLFVFSSYLSFLSLLSPSLSVINSIFLLPSSILYLAVQTAQFNNELSLRSFSFPSLPTCLITPPNSSSHSFITLVFYFMNGPRLEPLLLVFVHPGTQDNSAFVSLIPPPLISTLSAPSLSFFPSSSLDNFVRLVVMLLSF